MNKDSTQLSEIKLVGITARTSNAAEMSQGTAQIGKTMGRFFTEALQEKMKNRKHPGKVFAVYTAYETDEHGAYTYFLGEEVTSFEGVGQEFSTLTIPAQTYVNFTSDAGTMPDVVINMWKAIWNMDAAELGGKRAYVADFEVYDERSHNLQSAVADVYIGVKE